MKSGLGIETCVRRKIFGEVCEMFPKRLIMDHEFDISHVDKFLENNDISVGPALKVILLVRDPRAVANSREFMGFCDGKNNKTCVDVPKLCNKLDTEVNTGINFCTLFVITYKESLYRLRSAHLCLMTQNPSIVVVLLFCSHLPYLMKKIGCL